MTVTIDNALEQLAGCGPEFGFGKYRLSNHGPMAAEALVAMGRECDVTSWVDGYKDRLEERPESRKPIADDAWREALGDASRVGDWSAFFERELAQSPWRDVLERWTERLAPGIAASATHGVIRTAHAVRSLAAEDTPLRQGELAEGLAYWAATYLVLPGTPSEATGGLRPSEAVQEIERFPPEGQGFYGTITNSLLRLTDQPSFSGVINVVEVANPSAFLSDLTETSAKACFANTRSGHLIGLIHAVTGPSAVRLLAPHLSAQTTVLTLRYAWQAAAGLFVTMIQHLGPEDVEAPPCDQQELIDRAVESGDEHAIKLTEVCLREYAIHPRAVYLAAAHDVSARLTRRT